MATKSNKSAIKSKSIKKAKLSKKDKLAKKFLQTKLENLRTALKYAPDKDAIEIPLAKFMIKMMSNIKGLDGASPEQKAVASKYLGKNIVIAQSGGPTAVINTTLAAIVFGVRFSNKHSLWGQAFEGKILGAKHGIDGILKDEYVDLTDIPEELLETVAHTPSSALGSCRHKPDEEDCRKILKAFKRNNVGFFFYIGGNDSADTARIVGEAAQKDGYPIIVVHVPKTIDNDLRSCYYTPGFGSAARFVACAVRGDDLDNRALGGVKIDVIMGRDAGFLTAASAVARKKPDDGPHLIYLPEVPFSIDKFVRDVKAVVKRLGRCVVAVSEGIRGKDGVPIAAKLGKTQEVDSHGNVQMSGSGALGDYLANAVKATGIKRVRADTFGYLQRSFVGCTGIVDQLLANMVGAVALECAKITAYSEQMPKVFSIGTTFTPKPIYDMTIAYFPCKIEIAAKETRSMRPEFIAKSGTDVTEEFILYAKFAALPMPETETLI